MKRIHAIHTTGGLDGRYGGPSRSVTALCSALAANGANVDLVSGVNSRIDNEPVLPGSPAVGVHIERAWQVGRMRYYPGYPGRLHMLLAANPGSDRLIHDHGLWGHFNWCAWRASRRFRVPYLLSPRGMIEPWAMGTKRWKKRLAMAVFQRRILETADLFVATAASEYESIRAAGLRKPVVILPNGIDAEAFATSASSRSSAGGVRTALFLSRIHPTKGLLNLVEAWAGTAPAGWRLLIAGPDEDGHLLAVRQAIRQWHADDSVMYVGPVEGRAKWDLYRSADLFVLPTFSENFGLVIAEALACGVPVITTRAAPWSDLVAYRCGWWVEVGVAPLASALREATSMDAVVLRAMGGAGQSYVRRYDWTTIAEQMADTYRWVLHGGARPEWVYVD